MSFIPLVDMSPRLRSLLGHAQPTSPTSDSGWFRLDNQTDDDTATLTVYDEIGWYGTSDAMFAEALSGVTAKNLTVHLNSPGGSVFQGIAIANLLRSHPAHVTVSVDALAASIASVIMLAGDEIVGQPNSQIMIHKASGLCLGNDDDMEEMRGLLRRQSQNIARAYAARAGGRWDTWYNRMAAETWFSDDEALGVGLIDRIAEYPRKGRSTEPDPAAETDTTVWDLSVFRYAGREQAPPPDTAPVDVAPPPDTGGQDTTAATGGQIIINVTGAADLAALAAVMHQTEADQQTPTATDTTHRPQQPENNETSRLTFGRRTNTPAARTLAFGRGGAPR